MFKTILKPFSIPIATTGMQHYWKGNYQLSERRLSMALNICPEAILESPFEGCLGLSLHRNGKTKNAKKHLLSAQKHLSKSNEKNSSIKEIKNSLSQEIEKVLSEY